MTIWMTQLFNGLSYSSLLLLIALGLAITFGLMKVINMAHGDMIMIGAYVTYSMQLVFSSFLPQNLFDYYFILSIPIAFLITAGIGILLEKSLIRFLYNRPLDSLLATWGVSLILQQLARTIFGAPNVAVKTPSWLEGGLQIASMTFPYKRLFILVLVTLCIVGLYMYLYRTAAGRRMNAVTLNRQMASCLGINTKRVDAGAFALGSGLGGIAGCALTLLGPVGPTLGTNYIVDAFMIVILGGTGKIKGTVVGALCIGLISTFIEFGSTATLAKVVVFALIILFLQWRPSGIISVKSRALD
ncbi:MAG: urea ABC transporter permease subunit UrtB [Bacillus sp. (in: firmicutes)]